MMLRFHAALIVFVLVVSVSLDVNFSWTARTSSFSRSSTPSGIRVIKKRLGDFLRWSGSTAPVRLIAFFFPSQIEIATIAYGLTAYSQIALPLIITITSKLNVATKSLIIT